MQAALIMSRILLKLSTLPLDPSTQSHSQSTPMEEEESKTGFDQQLVDLDTKAVAVAYQSQAAKYLKQALSCAYQLNKVLEMRECSYLLALIYNGLSGSGGN